MKVTFLIKKQPVWGNKYTKRVSHLMFGHFAVVVVADRTLQSTSKKSYWYTLAKGCKWRDLNSYCSIQCVWVVCYGSCNLKCAVNTIKPVKKRTQRLRYSVEQWPKCTIESNYKCCDKRNVLVHYLYQQSITDCRQLSPINVCRCMYQVLCVYLSPRYIHEEHKTSKAFSRIYTMH